MDSSLVKVYCPGSHVLLEDAFFGTLGAFQLLFHPMSEQLTQAVRSQSAMPKRFLPRLHIQYQSLGEPEPSALVCFSFFLHTNAAQQNLALTVLSG